VAGAKGAHNKGSEGEKNESGAKLDDLAEKWQKKGGRVLGGRANRRITMRN